MPGCSGLLTSGYGLPGTLCCSIAVCRLQRGGCWSSDLVVCHWWISKTIVVQVHCPGGLHWWHCMGPSLSRRQLPIAHGQSTSGRSVFLCGIALRSEGACSVVTSGALYQKPCWSQVPQYPVFPSFYDVVEILENSRVSQDQYFQKPCCASERKPCSSTDDCGHLRLICSSVLHKMQIRATR